MPRFPYGRPDVRELEREQNTRRENGDLPNAGKAPDCPVCAAQQRDDKTIELHRVVDEGKKL